MQRHHPRLLLFLLSSLFFDTIVDRMLFYWWTIYILLFSITNLNLYYIGSAIKFNWSVTFDYRVRYVWVSIEYEAIAQCRENTCILSVILQFICNYSSIPWNLLVRKASDFPNWHTCYFSTKGHHRGSVVHVFQLHWLFVPERKECVFEKATKKYSRTLCWLIRWWHFKLAFCKMWQMQICLSR